MRCPKCRQPADCKDSRERDGWRWRRFRCGTCNERFSTAEFYVGAGTDAPRLPENFLRKIRAEGAAQMAAKLQGILKNLMGAADADPTTTTDDIGAGGATGGAGDSRDQRPRTD